MKHPTKKSPLSHRNIDSSGDNRIVFESCFHHCKSAMLCILNFFRLESSCHRLCCSIIKAFSRKYFGLKLYVFNIYDIISQIYGSENTKNKAQLESISTWTASSTWSLFFYFYCVSKETRENSHKFYVLPTSLMQCMLCSVIMLSLLHHCTNICYK